MSVTIHPMAIVERGAELGDGCEVGPFCCVGAKVRLGANCRLHSHVVVDGNTTVGEGCEFFSFACIGKQTQDLKWTGGTAYVEIGKRNRFREYVTVHASSFDGGKTVVGDDCNLLAYCHIAHDCVLGSKIIMSNNTQIAGHVVIEDQAVFGGQGGVAQFNRIGRLAMVGATAKVVQDIAPFCLVNGAPAAPVMVNKVGLERAGFAPETIKAMNQVYKVFFRSNLTAAAAIAQLRQEFPAVPEVTYFLDFVAASQRGVARPEKSA